MTNSDFNTIKPVEGLQNVAGITPAKRREERKRRQDRHRQKDETADEQNAVDELTKNEQDQNDDNIGIDYRA